MNENLDDYVEAYDNDFLYSLDNRLILQWYPQRILKKINDGSLLELGLGHGHTIQYFLNSQKISHYRIIEGSEQIIENFLRQNYDVSIDIIHDRFETYDSEDKFDNIVMGFVLEHVDDPVLLINKYIQYLKPESSLFITVPNSDALNRRFGYEAGLLDELDQLSEADLQLGHKRYFNLDSLNFIAQKCGLTVKSFEGLFLKPITTNQIKLLDLDEKILHAMLKVGIKYPELCTGILMEATVV